MDAGKIKDLEQLLEVAHLIERCQTMCLISSDDRQSYFTDLNDKAHALIPDVLSS